MNTITPAPILMSNPHHVEQKCGDSPCPTCLHKHRQTLCTTPIASDRCADLEITKTLLRNPGRKSDLAARFIPSWLRPCSPRPWPSSGCSPQSAWPPGACHRLGLCYEFLVIGVIRLLHFALLLLLSVCIFALVFDSHEPAEADPVSEGR